MTSFVPCIKCDITKPIDHFYTSTIRRDNSKGQCKSCVITRVNKANSKPHRQTWFTSNDYKKTHCNDFHKYAAKYPNRQKVRSQTSNAIKKGELLKPEYCEQCNCEGRIEAHHDDYNKPFEVRWLCAECHGFWHRYNEPIYQAH